MNTTYSYSVTSMVKAPLQGNLTDVVTKASFQIQATVEGYTVLWDLYNINLLPPDPENFIPFADLTETMLISWLELSYPLGPVKENLEKQLDDIINPKEVVVDFPWVTSTT